jgi:serine/threonine protein kinase
VSLKKLGRYDLVRVLGKGAMGVVYEGRDPNLERRVAIKTVKVENLSEEAAAEYESRFRTEARSAARLQHPNIVSVYDSDRDGDIAFLVMEYIQGDDLKHHLDRGIRYSLEQSLKMVRDLLAALDYAHKAGIVHRDIKPANLLIEPGGRVKLTDFGVARIQDSGDATRTQGSMVGTLKYMSPEQVQGLKIDSRADLFSVGVVLYQLLTDKRPFDGDNDFSIIHQIIGHTPPPPSSFNARLPPAIDAVVARALAKDREQRFATARDFASALQSAIRRAEDATVVPPADPFKKPEQVPTNRGTAPSAAGVTGGTSGTSGTATVTQELELVYWKDMKDSTDPEEFEGFLHRFPDGIYADLARRRLRRLTGNSIDATTMNGAAGNSAAEDPDATRVRQDPSIPMAAPLLAAASAPVAAPAPRYAAVPSSTGAASPAAAEDDTQPRVPEALAAAGAALRSSADSSGDTTTGLARNQRPAAAAAMGATTAAAAQSAAVSSHPPAAAPSVKPAATPRPPEPPKAPMTAKKKPPVAVLAGVGAVAVVALAAFMMAGRGGDKPLAAAIPAASAPGQPASELALEAAKRLQPASPAPTKVDPASVVAIKVADGSESATAVAPAPPPAKASHVASSPRKAASAAKKTAPPSPLTQPDEAVAPATPAPSAPRESALAQRPPPAPVQPRSPPPSETCKDKIFLSLQLCLQEECAKPASRNAAVCVKFREEARIREESKVRN